MAVRTPTRWSHTLQIRPTLAALRDGFSPDEIQTIRSAYREAGARFGDSEVGMWAWLLSQERVAAR